MRASLRKIFLSAVGLAGTLIATAAGVSPSDAGSNVAAWMRMFGIADVPAIFVTRTADHVTTGIGLCVGLGALAWIIWSSQEKAPTRVAAWVDQVPLHEALRYVGQHSKWAALRDPRVDGDWLIDLNTAFVSEMSLGHLKAHGRYWKQGDGTEAGPSLIETEFWRCADLRIHDLVFADEPDMVLRKQRNSLESYVDPRIDRHELEAVWPRRSLWHQLTRRSPAERTGADKEWRRLDAAMKRRGLVLRPGEGFRELFGR